MSKYFSPGNFGYAVRALAIMRKILVSSSLLPVFHLSTGEWMPLWVLFIAILLLRALFISGKDQRHDLRMPVLLLSAALTTWFAGSWYWLVVQSGENQIRYFYPFLLMGCICLVPAALIVWPRKNRVAAWVLLGICVLPALNITALLAAGDSPSKRWQYLTGVSVSVGGGKEEGVQAYSFLKQIRKEQGDQKVYFFPNDIDLQTSFAVIGPYEKLMRPDLPSFSPTGPIDWIRGFAVRINELLECDYILLNKYDDAYIKSCLSWSHIDTFDAESKVFESWMLEQNGRSGLQTVSESPKLLLLRIADRVALSTAIDQFVAKHKWRPDFYAANKPRYWDSVSALATAGTLQLAEIGFGGIYQLHALAINGIERGIQIDVWWEELRHEDANNQRFLFFHIVDASGKIVYNQQISLFPYAPPSSDKRWQHGALTFENIFPDKTLKSIAFGIYQPNGPFLFPDRKLASDWEGRRILIPLNAILGTVLK